jgi:cytochrome c-type biogenesis protein CcmF
MIALGVIGDAYFKQETQGALTAGQSLNVAGYSLRFEGLKSYPGTDGREITEADTVLSKDGQTVRPMQPRRDFFVVQEQPVTVPAVYATAGTDVYIMLLDWQDEGRSATFKIYINSLINWVWGGGFMMILGTLIAAWPPKDGKKEVSYQLKPQVFVPHLSTGD